MKTLTFWLLFILIGSAVCAQIPSSCTPTAAFLEAYKHDINYLAAKRMQDVHHPDTQYVTIPSIHKDSIISALATVFNLGNLAQADSVFYYRCMLPAFFPTRLQHILIQALLTPKPGKTIKPSRAIVP